MEISSRYAYPPLSRCIYCGAIENLSEEHIIPYALDGHLVLPNASCSKCAGVTKRFEQICAREMFGPLRIRLDLKTRRKKERPKHLPIVTFDDKGNCKAITVSSNKFPRVCMGLKLPAPGILLGEKPTRVLDNPTIVVSYENSEIRQYMPKDKHGVGLGVMHCNAFILLLAKIAHAFAVAKFGIEGFKHRLPPLIVGADGDWEDTLLYLVGGDTEETQREQILHSLNHRLVSINSQLYVVVTIHLFAFMGMPRYQVVVGEALLN